MEVGVRGDVHVVSEVKDEAASGKLHPGLIAPHSIHFPEEHHLELPTCDREKRTVT